MKAQKSRQPSTPNGHLRPLVYLWLFLTALMIYEYLALNKILKVPSFLLKLHQIGVIPKSIKLTTEPGGTISYFLGIVGFGIICLTNYYIWRKKRHMVKPSGTLGLSLDYHILCGLLGPTLIVFHSDFKVHGLVAISFWSMVVCFLSGVVGRYFYIQLLRGRQEMLQTLQKYDETFEKARIMAPQPWAKQVLEQAKWSAFVYVGGSLSLQNGKISLPGVVFVSLLGDIKRYVRGVKFDKNLPNVLKKMLLDYAVIRRRYFSTTQYKQLMGYWHTFHKPFAIFMYVVSVIHIIAAVTLRVQ